MVHYPREQAFTLIELLVVIAIVAILASIVMPSLSTANDRANLALCQARLEQVGLALREYQEDTGCYPKKLSVLFVTGYVDSDATLLCSKTGRWFAYREPSRRRQPARRVASCVNPPVKKYPHGQGRAQVELLVSGRVQIVRKGR